MGGEPDLPATKVPLTSAGSRGQWPSTSPPPSFFTARTRPSTPATTLTRCRTRMWRGGSWAASGARGGGGAPRGGQVLGCGFLGGAGRFKDENHRHDTVPPPLYQPTAPPHHPFPRRT